MSKKFKIFRIIQSVILFILSAFLIYCIADSVYQTLNVEMGGLSVLGLILISLYTLPVLLYVIIFEIVMLCKKKFYVLEFIASIIFIVCWASLYIVPVILSHIQ